MYKLITPIFILIALFIFSSNSFAIPDLHCHFSDRAIKDIESIVFRHDKLVLNESIEIQLDMSEINCSTFGRQLRLDGSHHGYQVILKTCTSDGVLEGRLIDLIKQEIGDIICHSAEE